MKKLICIAVILFPVIAFGQNPPPEDQKVPKALVKLLPLYFFSNTFELGTEIFNKNFDRSFNFDLGFRSGASDYSEGNGVNAEIAYRKYISPMKLHFRKDKQFYQGIYYSLSVRGETFNGYVYDYSYGTSEEKRRVNSIAPGFTLGLQKTLWELIYLDVYFGGGIKFSDYNDNDDPYYNDIPITDPGYDGIFPKVGVKIGVGL